MIDIRFYRNSEDILWGYTVSGHAGLARTGKDILCAAVSALSINTANSFEELLGLEVISSVTDGYLSVELPLLRGGEHHEGAELLMASLKLGLEDIASQYDKRHVTVSTEQKA